MSAELKFDPSTRTPELFAIEFGEYMAKSAEQFLNGINNRMPPDEIAERSRSLRSSIYEFRKRALRTDAWLGAR